MVPRAVACARSSRRLGAAATANSQSVVVTADRMIDVLGRERDVGAIAVGRYGDLVAVAGDPLQNVRLLENVAVVIKGGAVASDRRAAR